MLWKKEIKKEENTKTESEKLPGPRSIEELVGRQMVIDLKKDPDWVWQLRSVVRRRADGPHRFDFRIFEEDEVKANNVKVRDYTSLDRHQELIAFQGWFDKISMEVHFEDKQRIAKTAPAMGSQVTGTSVRIFNKHEIWHQIVDLSEPGSTIFFYLAGSPSSGGPLGRGAAVIELNPNYPGKKQKRYNVYCSDVDGQQPVSKRQKMFDTDSSKDIAEWVKERHYQPSRTG